MSLDAIFHSSYFVHSLSTYMLALKLATVGRPDNIIHFFDKLVDSLGHKILRIMQWSRVYEHNPSFLISPKAFYSLFCYL